MKNIRKMFLLTASGLFSALFLYPLAHETGHILAALLAGGKVSGMGLFPVPYMECNTAGVTEWGIIAISLSGLVLPVVLSVFFHAEKIYLWYAIFIFKIITAFSLVIEIVVIMMKITGNKIWYDDITKALDVWKNGTYYLLTAAILFLLILLFSLIKEHPIKKLHCLSNG